MSFSQKSGFLPFLPKTHIHALNFPTTKTNFQLFCFWKDVTYEFQKHFPYYLKYVFDSFVLNSDCYLIKTI